MTRFAAQSAHARLSAIVTMLANVRNDMQWSIPLLAASPETEDTADDVTDWADQLDLLVGAAISERDSLAAVLRLAGVAA